MPTLRQGPFPNVVIRGGATAFPSRTLDNADVLRWLDPDRDPRRLAFAAEGLSQTLGVRTRAWARLPGDAGSDVSDTARLATEAARDALSDAEVGADEVDVLIVATSTPPRWTSTVSSSVGGALGLRATAFDLRSGCAGALIALSTAAMYLQHGARNVLVVGADTFSKAIPANDRTSALLLGDGAAAVVIGRGAGALRGACTVSDGALGRLVHTPGALPPTPEDAATGAYALHGDPTGFADAVPALYAEVIAGVLDHSGLVVADVRYVPHQAGRAVIHAVADRFGIPRDRTFEAVDRHANTGAASALTALVEARREGFVGPGDDVLLASVGGGMSAAALVWRC